MPVPFSKRKAVPHKPRDYKADNQHLPTKSTIDSPLTFGTAPITQTATHSTYLLAKSPLRPSTPITGSTETILKHYPISTPTAYIHFEALITAHLSLMQQSSIAKDSPRVVLANAYASTLDSFAVARPAGVETLENSLTILGKKRIFTTADAWKIISDVCEGVRDLNESQMAHLGIKPENIILCDDKTFRLTDMIFNDYVIQSLKKEEDTQKEEMLKSFPHMSGKTEHTVVIFNRNGNDYINSKNKQNAREVSSQAVNQKTIGSSYLVGSSLSY